MLNQLRTNMNSPRINMNRPSFHLFPMVSSSTILTPDPTCSEALIHRCCAGPLGAVMVAERPSWSQRGLVISSGKHGRKPLISWENPTGNTTDCPIQYMGLYDAIWGCPAVPIHWLIKWWEKGTKFLWQSMSIRIFQHNMTDVRWTKCF